MTDSHGTTGRDARGAWVILSLFLLVGCVIRLYVIVELQLHPVSDALDFHFLAKHLAGGEGYTLDGKPTAYRPPGFPLLLALAYRFISDSVIVGQVVQTFLELTQCFLLFVLGRRIFSDSVGLAAAGLWASYPVSILQANLLLSEPLFGCLFLSTLALILSPLFKKNLGIILLGILFGWAALIKPFFVVAPFLVAMWMLWCKIPAKETVRTTLLSLLVMCCVLFPWVARNTNIFHRTMVSSNGGINLWIGNNEHASGGYRFNPSDNPFRGIDDETTCDRLGFRLAGEFVSSHPLRALSLMPKKLAYLFSSESPYIIIFVRLTSAEASVSFAKLYVQTPIALHLGINFHYLLFIAAGTLGFVFMPKEHRRELLLILLFIGLWMVVHMVFFGNHRFHYPLMPLFVLGSAYATVHLRNLRVWSNPKRMLLYTFIMVCFMAILVAEVHTAVSRAAM